MEAAILLPNDCILIMLALCSPDPDPRINFSRYNHCNDLIRSNRRQHSCCFGRI
jgi:hypothetical protein